MPSRPPWRTCYTRSVRGIWVLIPALLSLSAPLCAAADERPRVDIPLADSTEDYAATRKLILRLQPDEWGVRGMWRGQLPSTRQSVLVIWFDSKAQTIADPAIAKAVGQLFERFQPELERIPTIDIVVVRPFLSVFLGEYALRASGGIWIRDGRSAHGWRPSGPSAQDIKIFGAVIHNLP